MSKKTFDAIEDIFGARKKERPPVEATVGHDPAPATPDTRRKTTTLEVCREDILQLKKLSISTSKPMCELAAMELAAFEGTLPGRTDEAAAWITHLCAKAAEEPMTRTTMALPKGLVISLRIKASECGIAFKTMAKAAFMWNRRNRHEN